MAAALDNIYTEIHVKCDVETTVRDVLMSVASGRGWHPSRNPFAKSEGDRVIQFINRRFYGLTSITEIDDAVDAITRDVSPYAAIQEIKYETAVFDSNDLHDRWWMDSTTNK